MFLGNGKWTTYLVKTFLGMWKTCSLIIQSLPNAIRKMHCEYLFQELNPKTIVIINGNTNSEFVYAPPQRGLDLRCSAVL